MRLIFFILSLFLIPFLLMSGLNKVKSTASEIQTHYYSKAAVLKDF